jgi:type IV secretion system protein VirD4
MGSTKILWGQVIAVLCCVLLAIWAATQWTAHALAHQEQLGVPWFSLLGWPVYHPYDFFWWWFVYDAYAPAIFQTGGIIAASGGLMAVVVAIAMSVWRARETRRSDTYGSAIWADSETIERAGLAGETGVIIGEIDDHYLRHDGPEHVLCFAPTRSGKGVGMVLPTLLTWPGSAIIHDIKGENWKKTAGFRARHGRVMLFDPTNPLASAYNPLLEIRRGQWEVRDAQNVADVLVDPEGSREKRNHWEKTSHSLLVGAIIHVLYAEKDKSLAGVATFLSDPRRPIESTLRAMMTTRHLGEKGVHPVAASIGRELLNKSENERSGVLSTAMSFLGLYRDPVIAQLTSRSDWRITDLVNGDRPASLYFVVPPSDISRTTPIVRLVLNQIARRLTEELEPSGKQQRMLLMLDEFTALGRLDFFERSLAFIAGYQIKAFLIAQSLNQIEKEYGQNNSILDNCHVRIAFATNDERTAKRVSEGLGTATEMQAMKNYAGHRLSPWLGHVMISRSETARPLLTPGEIQQLPEHQQIVMVAGFPPIRAFKAKYFTDIRLAERVIRPPKLSGSRIRRVADDDWTNLPIPPRITRPGRPCVEPEDAGANVTDEVPPVVADPGDVVGSVRGQEAGHGQEDEPGEEAGNEGEGASSSDPDNSGVRREPELGEHEDIAPSTKLPTNEFSNEEEDRPAKAAVRRRQMGRAMRGNARNAALDPDDGIEL